MFDFWYELPPILRALMGLVMIGIAVLLWFLTGGRLYTYGLAIVGLIFLLGAGAGSDKGGYKF
jgi:hypothetical protein